ncbi:MAG: hypothetical protein Q7T44_05520 [Parvibaculum sp.]|nr:hypothetical protein [Parvibaculum sp.]
MTLEASGLSASPSRRIPWPLFIAVAVASTGIVLVCLSQWGVTDQGWLHASRYTARLAFLLFLAPFLASSLVYWWPTPATRWLRAKRRYLGLSFALAHGVHFIALVMFNITIGETPDIVTIIGGGGAYLMILLMALTSNDWSVRTLGPKAWGWLHWLGLYDIWFVFTFTYFGRFTQDQPQEPRIIYITLFAIALAALGLRIATRLSKRRA